MTSRVYAKPTDERTFLRDISGQGVYIAADTQPFTRVYELYDRVTLSYWSKGMEQAVDIPCQVVARRIMHRETVPCGIKVKVLPGEYALMRTLLEES